MKTYSTRPINLMQHPNDVLNDVHQALDEMLRENGLPFTSSLSFEPVAWENRDEPPPEQVVRLTLIEFDAPGHEVLGCPKPEAA